MRVHVLGPNLMGSKFGEAFHVHADVKRSPVYRGPEHKADRENAVDFASLTEIAANVYDFEEDPEELTSDFHVFPCAKGLPA